MNEKDFKKSHKPAICTSPAWRNLISGQVKDDTLRKIRQETIAAYGYSMDECPKRLVCMGTECLGRPLPWKSETAKPYLEQLKVTHTIKNDELYLTKCDQCPIKIKCKSPCHQINDFLNRQISKEPDLIFQENLENHSQPYIEGKTIHKSIHNPDIPWDCLSTKRQTIIKKYLYEGKDFLMIAKELNMNNQARVKYEFYAGLTRLSEFAAIRAFFNDNKEEIELDNKFNYLTIKALYFDNLSITTYAKSKSSSKQAVQQRLTRFIKKYNIKWTIFVKKKKNKLIYNVPMVFK